MTHTILISIGAGLLSALLFGSVLAGTVVAILLPLFAQLPIQTASLTFGPRASLIASVAAILALVVAAGSLQISIPFLINVAAPAVVASYLAGLRNTTISDEADTASWYPLGRILTVIAIAATIGAVLLGLQTGFDPQTATAAMQIQAQEMLRPSIDAGELDLEVVTRGAAIFVAILPFVASFAFVIVTTLNLLLAMRISRRYGAFKRPVELIGSIQFPQISYIIALLAMGAIWATGAPHPLLAVVAGASAALVLVAGFAALHGLTSHMTARSIVLFTVYGSIFLFGFPILLILILGWLDGFFNLRRRFGHGVSHS